MFESTLFSLAPDLTPNMPGQWRIARVQIVNWGTLQGYQNFDVPRGGLLLTGESGSGKSTVIDAVNTVLNRDNIVQYNMAASGGTGIARDRSAMTYVRGVFGGDDVDRKDSDSKLRTDTTRSGICVTFDNGQGQLVSGLRVFYVAGKAMDSASLKRRAFVIDGDVDLKETMAHVVDNNFSTSLNNYFNTIACSYKAFSSSSEFVANLYRRIGIQDNKAAILLQKTISTKNASNLDDLMRNYMLDVPETFARADAAVHEFNSLQQAHDDVLDAEEQISVLSPIKVAYDRWLDGQDEAKNIEHLQELLFPYKLELTAKLAKEQLETTKAAELRLHDKLQTTEIEQEKLEREQSTIKAQIDQNGGAKLQKLQSDQELEEQRLKTRERNMHRLTVAFELLEAAKPSKLSDFEHIQAAAKIKKEELVVAESAARDSWARCKARLEENKQRKQQLENEIASLKKRDSSLPINLVQLRENMASDLGISVEAFPYMAELIDIVDKDWRGAIERLLAELAKTLLVPTQYADRVARWVDTHHLQDSRGRGMRLVWQRVPNSFDRAHKDISEDSVLNKLKIKEHPLRAWTEEQLYRRADFICVSSPEDLAAYDYAISISGQIKRKHEHTKDDRRNLHDQTQWICGTSNKERLAGLSRELVKLTQQEEKIQNEAAVYDRQMRTATKAEQSLLLILEASWEDIDVTSVSAKLSHIKSQVTALLKPNSDLSRLTSAYEEIQGKMLDLGRRRDGLLEQAGKLKEKIETHSTKLEESEASLWKDGWSLSDAERADLFEYVKPSKNLNDYEAIDRAINRGQIALTTKQKSVAAALEHEHNIMLTQETTYINKWPNTTQNFVADEGGVEDFLERLESLSADNLPKFKKRFVELLNSHTQKNMASLISLLRTSFDEVGRRINEVNDSLSKTPFDSKLGAYLKLEVQDVRSRDAKEFDRKLREVTNMSLTSAKMTDVEAERRFKVAQSLIKRLEDPKYSSWKNDVLDTRKHVSFRALVVRDAEVLDIYNGSRGRSGGQSQKLVAFCLAAALRYRLADPGAYEPRYGSIILDEAFDKADAQFTRDALKVFQEFGFQLILAVPNSKIQVLEEFVDAVYMSRLSKEHTTIWSHVPFVHLREKESNS